MPRTFRLAASLLAAALVTAGCSGAGRPSGSPTLTPASGSSSESASASVLSPSSRPTSGQPDPLVYLHVNGSVLLQWTKVPRADRYVVTRLYHGTRTLDPGTTSYTWPDDLDLFDRRRTFVHPELVLVKAMRGPRVLHTFTGGESCPTLMFVAARGSGQNGAFGGPIGGGYAEGLGSRGLRVWRSLVERLHTSTTDLPAVPVDYPAVAVALGPGGTVEPGNLPGPYRRSVEAGVVDAARIVSRSLSLCPGIDIVLFGYSQGAQVIGDTYAGLPAGQRARVVRVILFADPQYHPADPEVRYLPAPLDHHGIKGERQPLPAGEAVIESWCSPQDVICQLGTGSRHFHGPVYDQYEQLAVANAASEIDLRERTTVHTRRPPTLEERLEKARHEQGG